jgi:hypothetical protein
MKAPSTSFNEIIPAGEEEKYANYAQKLKLIQRAKSQQYGKGRLLHRKGLLALKAEFHVNSRLPAHAAQGIFAKATKYDAIIRLSNGSFDIQSDKKPDIRGFALKVTGVKGKSILTGQATTEQDFVMINHLEFSTPRADDFLDLLLELSGGPMAAIKHLIKVHGFFGMFKAMGRLIKVIGKKFTSYATEQFSTALPIKNGDYAAKLRLLPQNGDLPPAPKNDLAADLREILKSKPLTYDVQLQFYTDAQTTPIEDASAEWPQAETPFITVGKLVIPPQELTGASYEKFAAEVELMKFDPWNAIVEHQPLGNVMRARKAAYFASQKSRGVA